MTKQQMQVVDAGIRATPRDPEATLGEMREGFETMMAAVSVPETIAAEPAEIEPLGGLRITPQGPRPGTLVYFHGGGYIVGSPQTGSVEGAHLAARSRLTTYVPRYRLAPEHPFPAAIEDALVVYRQIAANADGPVTLAGDSAGGGLAMATMLAAREASLPMPTAAVLLSPWVDLTQSGASMTERDDRDPLFTKASLQSMADQYLAGADAREPMPGGYWASPLFADLTGLPPLLIQVGGNEVLFDDSTRLAMRAIEADLEVTLEVIPHASHVFQQYVDSVDEAGQALDRAAEFLTRSR